MACYNALSLTVVLYLDWGTGRQNSWRLFWAMQVTLGIQLKANPAPAVSITEGPLAVELKGFH